MLVIPLERLPVSHEEPVPRKGETNMKCYLCEYSSDDTPDMFVACHNETVCRNCLTFALQNEVEPGQIFVTKTGKYNDECTHVLCKAQEAFNRLIAQTDKSILYCGSTLEVTNSIIYMNIRTISATCTFTHCVFYLPIWAVSEVTIKQCRINNLDIVAKNILILDCSIHQLNVHCDTLTLQTVRCPKITGHINTCIMRRAQVTRFLPDTSCNLDCQWSAVTGNQNIVVVSRDYDSIIDILSEQTCIICGIKNYDDFITIKGKKVHDICIARNNYSEPNALRVTSKSTFPSYSFELELHTHEYDTEEYQAHLLNLVLAQFKRCGDCTVSDELKSPIYNDIQGIQAVASLLEKSKVYIDEHCGTHIHVEVPEYVKHNIRRYRYQQLNNLGRYMNEHEQNTRIIWGRFFNHYAEQEYEGERYCWLNTDTSYNTLEYRLPRLYSAKQFIALVRFVRVFTRYLCNTVDSVTLHRNTYTHFYQKYETFMLKQLTQEKENN